MQFKNSIAVNFSLCSNIPEPDGSSALGFCEHREHGESFLESQRTPLAEKENHKWHPCK